MTEGQFLDWAENATRIHVKRARARTASFVIGSAGIDCCLVVPLPRVKSASLPIFVVDPWVSSCALGMKRRCGVRLGARMYPVEKQSQRPRGEVAFFLSSGRRILRFHPLRFQ